MVENVLIVGLLIVIRKLRVGVQKNLRQCKSCKRMHPHFKCELMVKFGRHVFRDHRRSRWLGFLCPICTNKAASKRSKYIKKSDRLKEVNQ